MSELTSSIHAPGSGASEFLIELRGVRKAFGAQEVLRGIDLSLRHGETLCIIGPSGEGKTVLMKHIIGLIQPDSGDVIVGGIRVNGLREREMAPIRRKVSMLFQGAALFDNLTVAENVAFPLWERGLRDRSEIDRRVREALSAVDLTEHSHKYPTNLSGGMRKRTGIARAIIDHSECILYDEPNSGLDPIGSDIIDRMIQRMQRRFGVTSIIVTHDMRSIGKIADRVAMLYRGVLHFLGSPAELERCADPIVQNFIHGRSDTAA
jgi:phospholipid/cholesterol/gamma-HCH transport system ATP-binding protein